MHYPLIERCVVVFVELLEVYHAFHVNIHKLLRHSIKTAGTYEAFKKWRRQMHSGVDSEAKKCIYISKEKTLYMQFFLM